jgi:hypothetical protein
MAAPQKSNSINDKKNEESDYDKFLRKDLLLEFFKGEWDNKTNTCKWKDEHSDDSNNLYVYAKVDTIINYVSGQTQKKIIIINSYKKDTFASEGNEIFYTTCHACGPRLSIIEMKRLLNSKKWEIENSNKFASDYGGNWGEPGKYELLKLWDNRFSLLVKEGYSNRGISSETIDFFLNCQPQLYTNSGSGLIERENEQLKSFEYKTSFFIDKVKKQLVVNNRFTDYNPELNKIFNVNESTKYTINNSCQLIKLK